MRLYLHWKLFSFIRILKFLSDHPTEVAAITDMAGDVTNLQDSVVKIQAAEAIQESNNTGVTDETKAAKKQMAETIIQFAHKGVPKARDAKALDVLKKLNHEVTYIMKAPKAEALNRSREIMKILSNATLFPNIKPANLTAMADSITAYDAAMVNPITVRETKKVEGTAALDEATKKADAAAENIYDYFYGEYQDTKPGLVKELADCMGLEIEGVRHTSLIGMCVDANPPAGTLTALLEGVLMRILELNLIATSDINGLLGVSKVKPGTYHVEFSKDGFVTKQMIIVFKRGKTEQVEVMMQRVTV